jgi:hypothetical protein
MEMPFFRISFLLPLFSMTGTPLGKDRQKSRGLLKGKNREFSHLDTLAARRHWHDGLAMPLRN